MRPCSLHSRSAEENCPTGNVLSRPSVKGAAPPCAANAAIPCGHVSKFEHNVLEVLIWTKKLMIARADVQTDYKLHISFRLAFGSGGKDVRSKKLGPNVFCALSHLLNAVRQLLQLVSVHAVRSDLKDHLVLPIYPDDVPLGYSSGHSRNTVYLHRR